jgi:hypothetical protein
VDAFAGRGDSHRACEHNPRVMFDQLTATLNNDILSWLRSINLVKGFSTLQLVISVTVEGSTRNETSKKKLDAR